MAIAFVAHTGDTKTPPSTCLYAPLVNPAITGEQAWPAG